jgi:EAL domain-containing protein (putative c-di-GMP-specific phosphodiesterase class I)
VCSSDLSHSLNLAVIAEGVEKESQAHYLLENGCEKMQGYLFSPPVPAQEFGRLLQNQTGPAC